MDELRRDDEHIYWLGDKRLIGVNEALNVLDRDTGWKGVTAAMHTGTCVHQMIEWHQQGVLDEASLEPPLKNYLTQYLEAAAEHPMVWEGSEAMLYHPNYLYAGTLDFFGTVDGVRTLVDFKTGKRLYPKTPIQLSAYQMMLAVNHGYYRRAALLLQEDYFQWQFYDPLQDATDWDVFRACLTLSRWKEARNGR